ncbi:MAG: M16 family metallopeptidase [Candidatus Hydrothermarchaeaceae archaeon]
MNRKVLAIIGLVLLATVLVVAWQLQLFPPTREGETTRIAKLDNGLTVIVKENHAAPIVALDVWVATGAINEDEENNGVSHFFEHMLFKGTERRGVGEFNMEIESLGGRNNAGTAHDFTHYYVVVSSKFFDEALDALSDVIMNSVFDADEIEKERLVVLEEKRRSLDAPMTVVFQTIYELSFPGHPYRRTVLGTMESISGLERDDFLTYYGEYYVPNNIAFVVVGDVDADEVIVKARDAFQDFKPREISQRRYPVGVAQAGVRRNVAERDVGQAYMGIAFLAPDIMSEDYYALDVMATILGEGRSSRLYQRIREEEQLVTSIDGFYIAQRDAGLVMILATLNPEDLQRAEEEILDVMATLREEDLPQEELDKAKTQLITEYAYDTETNLDQAALLGYYQVVAGDYNLGLGYPDEIEGVTAADVRGVALSYLTDEYSIVIVKPGGVP